MLNAPTFNLSLGSEVSGDDPLGLAPVNERLYGSVFPGINNVVRYIRIYALLCWAAWRVESYLVKNSAGLTEEDVTDLFDGMFEKIELLITWANSIGANLPGLVGTSRKFPDDDRRVTLRFEIFGTNQAAYMSAVQYRPSITNGLGFLEGRAHDTFACTESGTQLAMAMDAALQSSPHYKWLRNVKAHAIKRCDVVELSQILDVRHPKRNEQDVFLTRYIPDVDDGEDASFEANRRAGMVLTLRAVAAINDWRTRRNRQEVGASEDAIRASMARGRGPDGKLLELIGVEKAQAKWAVLQLRQYQRTCFEAFYVCLEYLLSGSIQIPDRSPAGVAAFMGMLAEGAFERDKRLVVADIDASIRDLQGANQSLYQAALKEREADLFRNRAELLDASVEVIDGSEMALLAHATQGLVFCAIEAKNLASDLRARLYLGFDDDKKPLSKMSDLINRFSASPIRDLVAHIVRHDVIERHYEVVAMRSRGGDEKNRFRFVEGESGLRRYDDSRNLPELAEAQDRLARALDLLEQCGLLKRDSSGFVVTKRGFQML